MHVSHMQYPLIRNFGGPTFKSIQYDRSYDGLVDYMYKVSNFFNIFYKLIRHVPLDMSIKKECEQTEKYKINL